MRLEIKTIKKHFQKSIDEYTKNAVVQKIMAKKLVSILPEKKFENILEIGSGAGLLTSELCKNIRFRSYYANDLVEKSECYVKKYIKDAKFFAGDFRRINYRKKFDLITSNAVFQWCDDLERVFSFCSNYLNDGGILAFSTFSPENFKEVKSVCGLSLCYKSVDDIQSIIKGKFELSYVEQFEYTMNFDNPLQILAHMKKTGVNSLAGKVWRIKEIKDFCEKYKSKYPDLNLTYSPIIVVLKKIN